MNKELIKEFEDGSSHAAWINSDIYPNGKISTQEYVAWLENELTDLRGRVAEVVRIMKENPSPNKKTAGR